MSYQVLALKWRPHSFSEMVGQQHVLSSLMNALDQDRLHHAYLFTGTRGVGKTSVARIMAKCLNCEKGVSAKPCNECSACQEIDQGRFMDLIEIDAASRTKVEDTREILDNVQYAPTRGRFKIYLIDEVHMLSTHSFNALLKTLEEPPPHVKFLLATTEPRKLPITVLSRCLQFYLKNIPEAQIAEHLIHVLTEEKVEHDAKALTLIARSASGSMRDALSLLDQAIAYGAGSVTVEHCQKMLGLTEESKVFALAQALVDQNAQALQVAMTDASEQTADLFLLLDSLARLLFEMSLVQTLPQADQLQFDADQVHALAKSISPEQTQLMYQIAIKARADCPLAPDTKTGFEMGLLRMFAFLPMTPQATPVQSTVSNAPQAVKPPFQKPATLAAPAPSVQKPAPVAARPAPAAPVAPSAPGELDWHQTVQNLSLVGMAKQLAAHCAFNSFENNRLRLSVAQEYAHILSDVLTLKLQKALEPTLGSKLKLMIDVASSTEKVKESPAAVAQVKQEKVQQTAEDAIAQDELANFIQAEFHATIQPNSLKPINKDSQ